MKIVYIDPQSYNNLAQYDYSLLRNLKGRIVYCCSSLYDMPRVDGVDYRMVFRYNRIACPLLKGLSYLWSVLRVALIVATTRPDVVHVQWWRQWHVDYAALWFYRIFAKQVVYTAHNVLPHDTGERFRHKSKLYYGRAEKIIVHAEPTRQELISDFNLPPDKVFVVRHGLINPRCDEAKVESIRRQLVDKHHLEGRLVFAALGIQSQYKGTDLLKQALLSSRQLVGNPAVFFFIIGKGEIITPGDFATAGNVLVRNEFVETEYMQAVLRLTSVLLLPYKAISQSGILLSSIQYHIPYLATGVGGLAEPLAYGDVGWLLPDTSAGSLRTAMEQLADRPDAVRAKQRDQAAWESVASQYDWATIGRDTMLCYTH